METQLNGLAYDAHLRALLADKQAGPVHICMYLAFFIYSRGRRDWFFVQRGDVMDLAKIKGARTYYRVIKDLVAMGVLDYWPSRNGKTGSRVKMR